MGAGRPHKRWNTKDPAVLEKLMQEGDYQQLWHRFQKIDHTQDVPDLGGYDVHATTRYIDRDFWHALLDPNYARHLGIGPIDTGLTPEQTVACLLEHEGVEKTLLDADNPIDDYEDAHEFATLAEHEKVRSYGGTPLKYERGLAKAIAFCEKKAVHRVPIDFACAPYLDEPDADDKRALAAFKRLGVTDASKVSKTSVNYGKADGAVLGLQHVAGATGRDAKPVQPRSGAGS